MNIFNIFKSKPKEPVMCGVKAGTPTGMVALDTFDEILDAFNEILDDDGDITFEEVKKYMLEEQGVHITLQEYRAARALYFS